MLKNKVLKILGLIAMSITLLGYLMINTQLFFGCYISDFGFDTMMFGGAVIFIVCICGFKPDKEFVKALKILILSVVALMIILFIVSRIVRCI